MNPPFPSPGGGQPGRQPPPSNGGDRQLDMIDNLSMDFDDPFQHTTLPPMSAAPPLPQLSPSVNPYNAYNMVGGPLSGSPQSTGAPQSVIRPSPQDMPPGLRPNLDSSFGRGSVKPRTDAPLPPPPPVHMPSHAPSGERGKGDQELADVAAAAAAAGAMAVSSSQPASGVGGSKAPQEMDYRPPPQPQGGPLKAEVTRSPTRLMGPQEPGGAQRPSRSPLLGSFRAPPPIKSPPPTFTPVMYSNGGVPAGGGGFYSPSPSHLPPLSVHTQLLGPRDIKAESAPPPVDVTELAYRNPPLKRVRGRGGPSPSSAYRCGSFIDSPLATTPLGSPAGMPPFATLSPSTLRPPSPPTFRPPMRPLPEPKGPLIEDVVKLLDTAAKHEVTKREEALVRYARFNKSGSRILPIVEGFFGLTGEDYASDKKEIARVSTRKPSVRYDEDGEDAAGRDAVLDTIVAARGGSKKTMGRKPSIPLGASYPFRPAVPEATKAPPELEYPPDSESEDDDDEPLPKPLPYKYILAEAERQALDTQYRSLRDTAVRTAQDAEVDYKRNGYTLKCLQSLCWKEAQLLSVRRRTIRMLQDVVLALRDRREYAGVVKAMNDALRSKIREQKGLLRAQGKMVLGPAVEDEADHEVLDLEAEDDDAGEMRFDADEGRSGAAAEVGMSRDLVRAWTTIMHKLSSTEKDAERGLRDALESHFQEAGMEALLGDIDDDGDTGRGGLHRSSKTSRKAAADSPPPRPLYYSTAPRGLVPCNVPLYVTPIADLPDYTIAVCHVRPVEAPQPQPSPPPEQPQQSFQAKGPQRLVIEKRQQHELPPSRQERVRELQEAAASEKLKAWERHRCDLSYLKSEVAQLETRVRMQKQRTDELNKWMNDGGGPIHKLEAQLHNLDHDIEMLRYRHRCELQITGIPLSEAPDLAIAEGTGISPPDLRMLSEAELGAVKGALSEEEDEDKDEKRRRLEQEELEEEAIAAAEAAAAAAVEEQPVIAPLSFRGRGRSTSFIFSQEDVDAGADSMDESMPMPMPMPMPPREPVPMAPASGQSQLDSLMQAIELETTGKAASWMGEELDDEEDEDDDDDDEDDEDEGGRLLAGVRESLPGDASGSDDTPSLESGDEGPVRAAGRKRPRARLSDDDDDDDGRGRRATR